MPAVASLTDFNRNQNAVLADLRDTQKPMYLTKNGKACTQKPMYLTKNGKACAVIMDAEAFDRMMAEREETRSQEERVYQGILRGIEEFQRGDTTDAAKGLAAIRDRKGWN